MAEAKYDDDPELYKMNNADPDCESKPWDEEKKIIYGIFKCFSGITSLFKDEQYQALQENCEVPYEKITDRVYLGSGAQGVVFEAHLDGVKVAVKQLHTHKETNIKHLFKMKHENIVRFLGVSTNAQHISLIMEHCEYGSLFDFLHSNTEFKPKQLLKWAKEICRGMQYLHANKIIHRDLKSPNILISHNLKAKVSDFGTSRKWNDVSAVMTFTGTVAWMAPEVIRHEPCSEKVDVWSFGVVLWELLFAEVPYKGLETHAIMWGVGTDSISLPIPTNCPSSLKQLLNLCWDRVPQNRPSFKAIAAFLDMAGGDLRWMSAETFKRLQAGWKTEIHHFMERLFVRSTETTTEENTDAAAERRENLKQARDLRYVYEQQVSRANELFLEVCAVRLQLEERERTIAEKESALKNCRCGGHRVKLFQRQESSSSDGMNVDQRHRKKKVEPVPAELIVQYDEESQDTVTVINEKVKSPSNKQSHRHNKHKPKVDTIIEIDENVDISVGDTANNYGSNGGAGASQI